ncbi:MAG: cob(I)yrinic acid a,c-diamide adenosyltransferase [bacterium]
MAKGYIHIYTGSGKGKTTAAFGLAVRSLGHSKRVAVIQFLKNDVNYGEVKFLSNSAAIFQFGSKKFVDPKNPTKDDIDLAKEALLKSREILSSESYDLVILDEIIVAASLKLISENDVLSLMKGKSESIELVLTGRGATERMINEADLVTEMKEVKHYFKQKVNAREGVEY